MESRAVRHFPALAQVPLWFLHQLDPEDTAYNLSFYLRLRGPIHYEAIGHGLDEIIARHESLRSRFESEGGAPMVIVAPHQPFSLKIVERKTHDARGRDLETEEFAEDVGRTTFDLAHGPLFRIELLRFDDDDNVLAFAFHHAVFDGWSIAVLFAELSALYRAFAAGEPSPLLPLPLQYRQYAEQQRKMLKTNDIEPVLAYWQQQLAGVPAALALPTDRPRATRQAGSGRTLVDVLPKEIANDLESVAQEHRATLFMVLVAAFAVLLQRHSGQDDIVIGTPAANRMRKKTRGLIGMLLNTLALRCDLSQNPTFVTLIAQAREVCLAAYRNQQVPFDRVVEAVSPARSPGANPIFQVMFILQTSNDTLQLPQLQATYRDVDPGATKFDLSLSAVVEKTGFRVSWEYSTELFDAETIEGMSRRFEVLLRSIARDPTVPISELRLLPNNELEALIELHQGEQDHSLLTTPFPSLFSARASTHPNAIAATFNERPLTYQKLDERANQLAHHLLSQGVKRGELVGLCVHRSLDMLVALLGIMRSGAAYVPIDPDLPASRIQFMVEDAQMPVLVTQASLGPSFENMPATQVVLERDRDEIASHPTSRPEVVLSTSDLAYVIYTSGSTGRPKGVRIQHGALANLLLSMLVRPGLTSDDRLLAITTISFDIAALELFLPLVCGARVVIVPREVAVDAHRLATALEAFRISVMQATPTTWRMLIASGWAGKRDLTILSGGEALPPSLVDELMTLGASVWNLYGPTETTIWSSTQRIDPSLMSSRNPDAGVPIGSAIHNTKLYVLDPHGQPCPTAVPGELHIGGSGLAEGYHARPELTAERFVKNPFNDNPDDRIYKTGDLVRLLRDNTMECLGRLDHQIKLRGFRVELGEIESALGQHQAVAQAIVVARLDPSGDARLVAYYVCNEGLSVSSSDLQTWLKEGLPAYMVPHFFMKLDRFPLTPNKKIDRKQLPDPGVTIGGGGSEAPPRDDIELQLLKIWETLLSTRGIGIHESFFDLGGHSILAVELSAKIEQTFERSLPLHTFFSAQTIAEIADIIRAEGGEVPWRALDPIKTTGWRPPIFFVGSTGFAKALEHVLPDDQPMYGLNVFGLLPEEGERFDLSVEKIATAFIKELRTIQPEGPYFLTGYCQDCKVALEMALQLRAQEQEVGMLGYIDVIWIQPSTSLKTQHYLRNLLSNGSEWLNRQIRNRAAMLRRRLETVRNRIQYSWKEFRGHPLPILQRDLQLLGRYNAALEDYKPRPYTGDMTVLLSGEFYSPRAAAALAPMATGTVRVVAVPGYHGELFFPPHVQVLADQLVRCTHPPTVSIPNTAATLAGTRAAAGR